MVNSLMFGTKIGKLLKNSGKKERIQFWFASMVTVTATLLYTMFAFGLSDITNDSLSKNDVQQLQGVLSSIILISIIAVMFFQWILATQLQNLFNIRKHFTEALLLMGTPHKKIVKIYVSELVQVHVSATLIGCVIGSSIYIVVANVLQIEERYVPVHIYLICVLIGILLNSYTIGSNLYKLLRGNIVEKIRNGNDYIKTNKINVKGVLVRICIAAILVILMQYISVTSTVRQIVELSKICNILAGMILFDPIARGVYQLLYYMTKFMKSKDAFLSVVMSKSYFRKVKITCMFLILSCTLFVGLHSLFRMVRVSGENIVDKNIGYAYVLDKKDIEVNDRESDSDTYYGLKIKSKTESGSNVFVSGIDSLYVNHFEKINVVKGSEEGLNKVLNENANSILMPEIFAASSDIGKTIKINMEGKMYDFIVAGLYYSNDFSELNCFVNINYLKDTLHIGSNEHNIVFFNEGNSVSDKNLLTKADIMRKSRERAVSGTEIVEAITYLLITCAVISLFIYYSFIAKSNEKDILRFQAMGMPYLQIIKIYIWNAVFPIIISGIFLLPITKKFTYICLYVMLSPYYFVGVKDSGIYSEIVLLLLFSLISIAVQMFYILRLKDRKNFIEELRNPGM